MQTSRASDRALIEIAKDYYPDERKDHATHTALAIRKRETLARIAGIERKHADLYSAGGSTKT